MPTPRLTPACLAALLLACGPRSPDSADTGSTGAGSETGSRETTTATTTTTPVTTTTTATTTGVITTTGVDPITGTDAGTTGTTAVGPCVADPASGTCTDGCDWWLECCKCNGQEFFPDPRASECTLAMGIVAGACPWRVDNVYWDFDWLPALDAEQCPAAQTGWHQFEQDGDIIIQLCGQSCTDYLAGKFTMIKGGMFCEVA